VSLDFFKFRGTFLKWVLDFFNICAGFSQWVLEFSKSCGDLGITYCTSARNDENDDIWDSYMSRDYLFFARNQDCTNFWGFQLLGISSQS